jgi:ABC-type proline/glycine betaine transport system ATPase subunit
MLDIAYGPKNMGLSDAEVKRRVADAVRFVGLDPSLMQKSPFDLSGGQKRRVAIAGIIAMEPEVLILDEPAAGLDPVGRDEIFGGVRAFQRERNSTVIIVSHSMEDMQQAVSLGADRIILGTIFETACKKGLRGKGLSFVREISRACPVPVYAIGGIKLSNIQSVIEAGAAGGCMMSGFMQM